MVTLAGNSGLTTILLVAEVVPQEPPLVVKVKVIGVVELAAAVKVAVPGVLPVLFVNVPLGADHTAAVAPPVNEPPRTADVPPWQIAVITVPALTVGLGLTVITTAFDVAGLPVKQGDAFEVMTQVTLAAFVNVASV